MKITANITGFVHRMERNIIRRAKNIDILAEYYRRTDSGKIDWKRQAETAAVKSLDDWKQALAGATDPDNPRRGELMRFYTNLLYDNHLSSTIDNRILPVQCAPFKLVDKAGNENTEAHKLLEKPWMLDLADKVGKSEFEGTKLIQLFDLNDKLEIAGIEEIPQSNFIATKGVIIREEWDTDGVSYKEGFYKDYYIQIGGDWQLGMLNQLAIIVLAKKLGIGSWMGYVDKFGVPPIFAITDRMDSARQEELFNMLLTFRQNQFAILQGGEKIEVPANYNVDAYNTFQSIISMANTEMSKRIQGSSSLNDEKSFVGAAEVAERLFLYRTQVDKLRFKFYFNEEIKPRLVKLSPVYKPLEGLHFTYDESENLAVNQVIEAVAKLSPYFEFNAVELAKITGLPITKIKSLLSPDSDGEDNEDPTDSGNPQQKKKITPQKKVKEVESSQHVNSGALLPVAAVWDVTIEQIARQLYSGGISPADLDKDCVLKIYADLSRTAAVAWGEEFHNNPVAQRMRENLLQFAGAKAHDLMTEIAALKKGMPEKEFIRVAKQTADKYIGAYADTERADTAAAANSAKDWQRFVKEQKVYRNLKFRTMGDGDVRPRHAALEGMVQPVGSPVWNTFTPPLEQHCRCWLEQTNEPETEPVHIAIDPVFQTNPGKTGVVFTEAAGYYERIPSATREAVRNNTELVKFYAPYGREEQAGDARVYVSDFADPADLPENLKAARLIAGKLGKDVYIRPHIRVQGYKNPEFAIGKEGIHGDLKNYNPIAKGQPVPLKNFVQNQLQRANKQGCRVVVLNLADGTIPDIHTLPRILRGELNGINRKLEQIIIIRGKKVVRITRKEVEKGQFKALEAL